MEIRCESLVDGARRAQGTVLIIDVFRAFTTAAVALDRGVSKIIFTAEPDDALALKRASQADICVGEVDGIPPAGFDYGNSPYELAHASIAGKVMAHSTRAGTVGVHAAQQADVVFGVSLMNAAATVEAVLASYPAIVTIVAMGLSGRTRTDEDELCLMYLRNLLEGRTVDEDALRRMVRSGGEVEKFMDPAQPHFHSQDVEYAVRINASRRVIQIRNEEGLLVTGG